MCSYIGWLSFCESRAYLGCESVTQFVLLLLTTFIAVNIQQLAAGPMLHVSGLTRTVPVEQHVGKVKE